MSGLSLSLGRAKRRDSPAFSPEQNTKLKAWLRLAASSQSGGEWTNWVDVLNANPGVINAARRPAVGASANGIPLATFATNDCVSVPLIPANNQTTKTSIAMWVRVGNLVGTNTLVTYSVGTAGASARKLFMLLDSAERVRVDAYIAGTAGRIFTTTAGLTQNAFAWVRLNYNSLLGGDANLTARINAAAAAGAYTDAGAGGVLTTLPTVTGNLLIGNTNDSAVASSPLFGDIAGNIYFFDDDLTAIEEANYMNFDRPT